MTTRGLFPELNKISIGKDLVADGTSEVLSAVFDMQDWGEITFLVDHGDVDSAAVMTYTVKENSANSTSSPTPTAITIGSVSAGTITNGALVITNTPDTLLDDKIIVISVSKQAISQRYVFLSITCSAESHEVDSILVVQSKPRKLAFTQSTDIYSLAKGYA